MDAEDAEWHTLHFFSMKSALPEDALPSGAAGSVSAASAMPMAARTSAKDGFSISRGILRTSDLAVKAGSRPGQLVISPPDHDRHA